MTSILKTICVFLLPATSFALLRHISEYDKDFSEWFSKYKMAASNESDYQRMLFNYAENDDFIITHNNRPNQTYTLGHNQFSHMNREDWNKFVNREKLTRDPNSPPPSAIHRAPANLTDIPYIWDWSEQWQRVTPVKNQGQCGSSWAFAATGALEGAHAIKYDNLVSFSEQMLVDCDHKDSGCNSGRYSNAFAWTQTNGGICTEIDYPYTSGSTGKDKVCTQGCFVVWGASPNGYTDVDQNDYALVNAIYKQPVAAFVDSSNQGFQLYKSGVYTGECGSTLNLGILLVGYGNSWGTDYYKLKNAWGYDWGLGGYMLLERGKNNNLNGGQCGLLLWPPAYPNIL